MGAEEVSVHREFVGADYLLSTTDVRRSLLARRAGPGHADLQEERLRLMAMPRRWLLVAVGVALAIVVVAARLLYDSRGALHAGEMSEARGDRPEAIRHYQDAARLYVPVLPGPPDTRCRLSQAARECQRAPVNRSSSGTATTSIISTGKMPNILKNPVIHAPVTSSPHIILNSLQDAQGNCSSVKI